MALQAIARALSLGALAGVIGVALAAPATAQQTYYDTGGVVSGPDLFETDGFRPVWEQELEIQARRARAKAAAQARAAAKAKAQRQAALEPPPKPLSEKTTAFDSWALTCQEFAAGKGRRTVCSAALRVTDPRSGQLVVLWNVQRIAKGGLRAVIHTPTGVQVAPGVEVQLGPGNVHKFMFESCTQESCEAVGAVDNALIQQIVGAPDVSFTLRARDGRTVTFKSPVMGFDKALAGVHS